MKAWQLELLGVHFRGPHRPRHLEALQSQLTLSKRQSRWMKVLAEYGYDLSYIPGEKNTVANPLIRSSLGKPPLPSVAS